MKFVIGRRAEYSPQPKECFVIEVEQMSGDADVYKTESFTFESVEENRAVAFAQLVKNIQKIQSCGYGTNARYIEDRITLDKSLVDLTGDIRDTISDICGYDVISDDYLAKVESFEIFWYNEFGEKFIVEMVDD